MSKEATMSFEEICQRVEASMCITYGAAHPEGRVEARISRDDWEALRKIVEFYGRHEHWMSLGEDGPRTLLVAMGDLPGADGWSMAAGAPPILHG
jgi:hypothetical protein